MAVFQNNSAQLVKDAADIVEVIGEHVELQKRGANYLGNCPFHSEKTPSFSVNPTRQFYHCFGCKESGDVLSFMMKLHNMTFPDALQDLARRYGVQLAETTLSPEEQERLKKRQKLFQVNGWAVQQFHAFLLENPAARKAREYLNARGVSAEVIKRFQLGYAPDGWDFLTAKLPGTEFGEDLAGEAGLVVRKDTGGCYDRFRDRIMCPIFSLSGQPVGFGGRILGKGQPKYLNTAETPVFDKSRTLFGFYQTKASIQSAEKCLVVEGNFDLLTLVSKGIDHIAAPLGTALTIHHVKILKRYAKEAIILFDGDEAGLKAAIRSVPLFLSEQLQAKVVTLPRGEDPDSFIRGSGRNALEKLIEKALPLPEFVFDHFVAQHGLSLEGKGRIIQDLQPVIGEIDNRKLQQTLFVSHFSEKLGISPDVMRNHLAKAPSSYKKASEAPRKIERLSTQHQQLLEFLLVYPDVLPRFIEAGLEDIFTGEQARDIIGHMKYLARDGGEISPELLLDCIEGPHKALVSKLLLSASLYSDETKEDMASEMEGWVRRKMLEKNKAQVVKQINEAQQQGDDSLMMQLLEKKKEMDAMTVN
ncbi:MAG: DNA primase [Desulfobulbaceae bacterium]|uniref:DNA primase n=1 Tax=Candidatus Desulfobia pelagia TaxID=2841692 RepID=A0A8J6NDH4_9BACT|nr:DNA primase [Candidatus Desulfobia pelagia]